MNKVLIISTILLLSVFSCGKPSLDIEYRQEVAPLLLQGEVYNPETNQAEQVEFTFGPRSEQEVHYTFQNAIFIDEDAEDTRLLVEVYDVIPYPFLPPEESFTLVEDFPRFALHFFTDLPVAGSGIARVSVADFEAYFQEGAVFPVGVGQGEVDVRLRLPEASDRWDLPCSRASFLASPGGSMEILVVEDYSFESRSDNNFGLVKGKIVEATFSATIGRYDELQDEMDGVNGFMTTEEIQLQNFRVRFFVPLSE